MESITVNIQEDLKQTIKDITQQGKGILAADESVKTATKRLESINVKSTENNRRRYREMLFSTEGVEEFISGVILFEETLYQNTDDVLLSQILVKKGIVPGIKVDQGLVDLNENEKYTQGLEGLGDRLEKYKKAGARFAKWRAVYSIGDTTPSNDAINKNAADLASYARVCQDHGLIPMVEPEILIDGKHSIDTCYEVTEKVLSKVFEELASKNVDTELIILKPSMVISGKENANRAGVKEVAQKTVELFKKVVPPNVPTINFLSGGQSPSEATQHLQAMNEIPDLPWILSFSYGRALQEPALGSWKGLDENKEFAQQALFKRAKLNSMAVMGKYSSELE